MKRLFALIVAMVVLTASVLPITAEPGSNTRDAVGMSLVGLNTQDLQGNPVTDAIFGGHTLTVMNYWATWCGPCIGEMPDFVRLYNHYEATAENDVQLWGVLMFDDSYELAEGIQMTQQNGWNWGHMRKNNQLINVALALVGDGSIPVPQTIIVDRSGTIRAHKRGRFIDYQEMYEYVNGWYQTLLDEEGSAIIPGDVDGSGGVNIADALSVLRFAMGLGGDINQQAGDMNGDGSIQVSDAIMVLRKAMGVE